MLYFECPPCPELAASVECVWTLRSVPGGGGAPPGRVFPDGCIELIVHARDPFHWIDESGRRAHQPRSFVVGQLSRPMWIVPPGDAFSVGVRFRPGGAYTVLGTSVAEWEDRVVPLESISAALAGGLERAVTRDAGDDDALTAIETGLCTLSGPGRAPSPEVRDALARLLSEKGLVRIEELADAVGWSARHLERRFHIEVGCSPKQLARVVRFQYLLARISGGGPGDWAGLAWDCGFADQAHLIREVRRLTEETPSRLTGDALAIARLFVSEERLQRYFATPPGPP